MKLINSDMRLVTFVKAVFCDYLFFFCALMIILMNQKKASGPSQPTRSPLHKLKKESLADTSVSLLKSRDMLEK